MRPVPLSPAHWPQARPFRFGDVELLDTDLDGAVRSLVDVASSGTGQGVHLCNAYTLSLAGRDACYRATLAHPGAVNLPDGTPVSWFYRLAHGGPAHGPVRGPSLMTAVLRQPGRRHFLLGGTPEVLAALEREIADGYPQAKVVGSLAPPFQDPDRRDIEAFADAIRVSGAEIVWVGLGTPRQDQVIAALTPEVSAVLVGVGAAFDFLSGHKPEAPAVLHRTGLEWVYRLLSEPRRLWRRYLFGNSMFVLQAFRQLRGR
jgi:N-acetylglucosaminyldiphosphoundecaprenol N-acetyl-beta-D-mannosaminyltransferase